MIRTVATPSERSVCLEPLIGGSPALQRARALIQRFAATRIPMLIEGPTGTGKELVARHIHASSGRQGRFLPVNCGAVPRDIAESLLFGHRRGAFSGAIESRIGQLERAHGGTLLLDELLSLPIEVQPKLLRALDTGEIQPLGEAAERFVDLRVIATVQETLSTDLETGDLRYDLYQRVAGVLVSLPPLSERPEDIVALARHFAEQQARALEPGGERVLLGHTWPGNVRELRMVLERAGQLVENGTLPPGALAEAIDMGVAGRARRSGPHAPERPSLTAEAIALRAADEVASDDATGGGARVARRAALLNVCETCGGDPTRIAAALRVSRATLYRRLRAAGLSLRAVRKSQRLRDVSETRETFLPAPSPPVA